MIVACVAIFLWIVVWGSSIASIEDWTFREGVWFGFISLTTIGFGDKAPDSHLGRMMAFAFIFVGMGIVAWFVQSIVQLYDRTKFWKAQRLYEKGYLSDKYMDVHEYCFKSPLGLPVRWKFLGFESNNAPRPPTLSREYQAMIDSSSPKVQSTEADEKGNASGDLVVDIKEGDGGKGEGKEARQLDAENSSDSLRKKKVCARSPLPPHPPPPPPFRLLDGSTSLKTVGTEFPVFEGTTQILYIPIYFVVFFLNSLKQLCLATEKLEVFFSFNSFIFLCFTLFIKRPNPSRHLFPPPHRSPTRSRNAKSATVVPPVPLPTSSWKRRPTSRKARSTPLAHQSPTHPISALSEYEVLRRRRCVSNPIIYPARFVFCNSFFFVYQ